MMGVRGLVSVILFQLRVALGVIDMSNGGGTGKESKS